MKILLVCTALVLAGCAADTGGSGGYATAGNTDDIEQKLDEIKQQQQQNFWQLRMDQQRAETDEQISDTIHRLDQ
jgi:hypothetical protein